ncbi:kelch repeat-containing protein [Hyalangium sp.]|uniref:Kelch repeat-containing protein n=1 Tax=Hyalangium sp. TaxID=2028555 RepID=UPI002D72E719|nr:kelch repeat-containing protein [Hyalangium sp.]HYH96587.1 kelch repeat-containing protein [Hyalangium sp.]
MWPRLFRHAVLAAVLALAPACQDPGDAPQVQLITTTCAGPRPLEGVTHLRLRVSGEGLSTPIERITPVDLRPEDIPVVPPGARRVLEVRAYSGEPSSAGSVVSVGRSFPFTMPEVGAPAEPVRVTLYRVNTFVPLESAQQPGTCLELTEPRAGHTATLLADGRVLLAGGFRLTEAEELETLSSIEILDPRERTLTALPTPGDGAVRRAFHTASLMLDGRVALVGGESQEAGGVATPLSTTAVFDPATQRVQEFALAVARSRHAAAIDIAGRILLVGGVGADRTLISEPEGVEPAAGRSFPVSTSVPRMGASLIPFQDGQRIAVIGGSDGVDVFREVLTFSFSGSTFTPANTSVLLRQARRDAVATAFGDGQRLIVLGGYSTPGDPDDSARPVSASELLDLTTEAKTISAGPSIVGRGELCAVHLPGGRIFTAGGRRQGGEGVLASTGVVELLTPTENLTGGVLGMAPLDPARYLHTCTSLPDGSVLVAGGVDASVAGARLAGGTYLFMPVPQD